MDRSPQYQKNSLSLVGAIALGTGVMIGAGIFALTGQMAEMTGELFPLAFLSAAMIVSFSAYSYVKMSNAYPSAGGIGNARSSALVTHCSACPSCPLGSPCHLLIA